MVAYRSVKEPNSQIMDLSSDAIEVARKGTRDVYFGDINDYRSTQIYDGSSIRHGMVIKGPAVVEETTTTIVIFPGQNLTVNRFGDFVLNLES